MQKQNNQVDDSWDIRIKEYEVDSSWRNHPRYKSECILIHFIILLDFSTTNASLFIK